MELGLDVSSKGIIPQEQWKNVKKTKKISNLVIFLDFVYLPTRSDAQSGSEKARRFKTNISVLE